jgi:hypothetical protein
MLPGIPALVAGLAALIIVSMITEKPEETKIEQFFDSFSAPKVEA